MLHFGGRPPFNFGKFLAICEDLLPAANSEVLRKLTQGEIAGKDGAVLRQWIDFDRSLRNELVKVRAGRKHIDPAKHLRGDYDYIDPDLSRLAISAYRNPSLLEGERMLDEARWRKLEELSLGHYFDFDCLIIYALKLLIVLRWQALAEADKAALLEGVFKKAAS